MKITPEEHAHWLALAPTQDLLRRLEAEKQAVLDQFVAAGDTCTEDFLRGQQRRARHLADTIKLIKQQPR